MKIGYTCGRAKIYSKMLFCGANGKVFRNIAIQIGGGIVKKQRHNVVLVKGATTQTAKAEDREGGMTYEGFCNL